MQKLTDSAALSEQLTIAKEELAGLRADQRRAARTAPGATTGTWANATRKLPPGDRRRITAAVESARNIFRWARRRRRLENARWERGDPTTELVTLVRGIKGERGQRDSAA